MRRHAVAAAAALSLATLASPGRAGAPFDLTPLASLDVSRWSGASTGFSELTDGPGAARDGDPTTAWQVPGADGDTAALVFDWSNPNALAPLSITSIAVVMSPPDAAITVQIGPDLGTLAAAPAYVSRDASGATITLRGAPTLRVLALRFPAGTAVAEVSVVGVPTGAGTLDPVTGTCDSDGVHLSIHGSELLGVSASRGTATGGSVLLEQRRASSAVLTDASVRFDPRPATYAYTVSPIGSAGEPAMVSVTCDGPSLTRPAPGPIHGAIEGFYGRPWTWHERRKVVLGMGALGMDTYVYAPKDDPLHRERWRDPYDATAIAQLKELADLGEGVGVNVVWAISPGLDIDPASSADVAALTGKVAAVSQGAGIRDAALLMDDIGAAHDAALGAAHASLAATLLASMKARDPAARLWFVPTVYAGLAGALAQADQDYVAALSALPAEVPIAWTGGGVFAQSIQLADAASYGGLAGRGAGGVWIWDNYPVNDIAVFRHLYARPITGRESLLAGSAGVLSNPMRHALASIPALASYAEMALDPAGYAAARAAGQPIATAGLALVLADAEGAPRALADLFAELVHHDTLWPADLASPELADALAAYEAASSPGPARRAAALDLATRLARLALADVDLRRDLDDQALADEIDAFARATSVSARAALSGMASARAQLLGDAGESGRAATRGACLWIAADQPAWRTIQDAVADLVPMGDTAACAPDEDAYVGPEPLTAVLGKDWSFDASDPVREDGASYALVDSDGAHISASGRITWTPRRLGRFRMAAIRSGDAGASARVIDVVVIEHPAPAGGPAKSGCACRAAPGELEAPWVIAALAALAARRRRPRSS
jgi:MYXO-CTERM domain-containing protein